jgi:hypothetical protein
MLGYPEDTVWVRYVWGSSRIGPPPAVPKGFEFREAVDGDAQRVAEVEPHDTARPDEP